MTKKNYRAWMVQAKDYPKAGTVEEQLRFLASYGVLSPSTHNTQPWLFKIEKNGLTILPNMNYLLPQADPTNRNLCISLGACAFNILVAGEYFDMHLGYKIEEIGQSLVKINLYLYNLPTDKTSFRHLFGNITKRYADKSRVLPSRVSRDVLESLAQVKGKARAIIVPGSEVIADLYYQAAASYSGDRPFSRELSSWLTGNRTKRHDGMPGFVNGLSHIKALVGKMLTRVLPKSIKVLAKRYYHLVKASPAVGVIVTNKNTPTEWAETGLLFQHIALLATSLDVSVTPLAAIVEKETYRKHLAAHLKIHDKHIQLFYRLTEADEQARHTPRRQPRFI